MKTISGIVALVMLVAGCATTGRVYGPVTMEQRDQCRAEADAAHVSTLRKTLLYSSNIIVWPVTTALTLGLAGVFVYPMNDDEWKAKTYEMCMAKIGG